MKNYIKICKNCVWAVFRGEGSEEHIIDDSGIGEKFLCRKLQLKIYGTDRGCPHFRLDDEHYQKKR